MQFLLECLETPLEQKFECHFYPVVKYSLQISLILLHQQIVISDSSVRVKKSKTTNY